MERGRGLRLEGWRGNDGHPQGAEDAEAAEQQEEAQGDASSVAGGSTTGMEPSSSSSSSSRSSSKSSSSSSSSGIGSSSSSGMAGPSGGVGRRRRKKKKASGLRSRRAVKRKVARSTESSDSEGSVDGRYLGSGASVVELVRGGGGGEGSTAGEADVEAGAGSDGLDPGELLHKALWTNKPREAVSIFWNKYNSETDDPNALRPMTLMEQFREMQAELTVYPAMRQKKSAVEWATVTWRGYYLQAKRVARSLMKMGIKAGMRVGIFAANSPQWCMAFLGSVMVAGIPVGIHDAFDEGSIGHILRHASITVLFIGGQTELEVLVSVLRQTKYSKLFAVVSFTALRDDSARYLRNAGIYPFVFDEFVLLAGTDESMLQRLVRRRQAEVEPGMCATIVYTPGASSAPKGCMLSHDNLLWAGTILSGMLGASGSDKAVSFMSLSSVYGLLVDLVVPLVTGHAVSFVTKTALKGSLGDVLREVGPSFFVGMPHIFERLRDRFEEFEYTHSGWGARNRMLAWARRKGLAATYAAQRGESMPWGYTLARLTTFLPFRQRIGLQNARIVVSMGSHISVDTLEFFQSLGLQIYVSYGMTECTGVSTLSLPGACLTGTVGRRLLGTGVSTRDDRRELITASGVPLEQEAGEGPIRVYGRNVFMGYFRMRKHDQAPLFDSAGWFETGDFGRFEGGFLHVDGKVEDVVTLADGTALAPIAVEAKLVDAIPGIEHAFVYGENKAHLVALFTPETKLNRQTGEATTRIDSGILRWIYESGQRRLDDDVESAAELDLLELQAAMLADVDATARITVAEVIAHPDVIRYVQTRVDAYNDAAPQAVQIHRWAFTPAPFTVYSGELDVAYKLRRDVVIAVYAELLHSLYE
ncbi:long-chain-fatty-acid-CoA ligase ACSBG2 [Thecamonas trahens ATCC 50062]|uniref:Long-chain-fatty-acid-CoA ligase ACSBG2 n=1 Tax=Thecamonas trahens ATCC 50062 TaxID=461836 RepID=A0A0L0D9Z8_THETB|nr:long-chain-fatty-acid-CoA ligase ACSBG2 [Thecamonas trahens ATCC 50062]KNC48103.1 long-chain-fatty-acid-CoA ligase ACSBG2 [Thecamonas trahens ATCC 50062]|eukprot:XP_013758678.1 long-chain-fatty-acid-CoA ligase ACSBG2 [Thecamonas trahens ATCC 50062]